MLWLKRTQAPRVSAALKALIPVLGGMPVLARAEGMPQLDFTNALLVGQVFWGAVIFIAFYFVLSRSALPRVAQVLLDRRQRIEGDLETARQARRGADHAVEELRRVRRESSAQAQENIDRVIREAREASEAQSREMAARLDQEIADAERRIASERADALEAMPEVATEAAKAILKKLLPSKLAAMGPSDENVEKAVITALQTHAG